MKRTGLPRTARPLSGPQYYWDAMRRLSTEARGFSVRSVHEVTNGVRMRTVRSYIFRCERAGLIEIVGETKSTNNLDANIYRVKVNSLEAPFERGYAFADTAGRKREQIWNAIRVLPNFTVRDLAIHAATDDVSISDRGVREYLTALTRAGYLDVVAASRGGQPATYRLKPSMNTGRQPPAVTSDDVVIDRNRRCVIGSAKRPAAEVRS